MFAQVSAPCTCPVCGAVRRTEPVLPVLPKRTISADGTKARRSNGTWVTIA
ncbi:hypothetical protein DOP62_14260 (plasmid) [Synechococcus elongatus PCC 11801]|uniref:Uncharacterized protein n=1 Tax=Synechococcus elongatus PCC 11801 TaxID=2219813 RepID=A0ACD5A314_SYNEL